MGESSREFRLGDESRATGIGPGPSIISARSVFVGDLKVTGDLVVYGTIEGNVSALGTVTIGEGADVTGGIKAAEVRVDGALRGNVAASSTIALSSRAAIEGDLQAPSVSIEPGAIFVGRCTVVRAQSDAPVTSPG